MKSSEFERLGDHTKKQKMTFEKALQDITKRHNERITNPSSTIYTDKKTLQQKERLRGDFPNILMINSLLHARNYTEKINTSDVNTEYFTNGKSTINIENGIRTFYKFEEFLQNEEIQSKGIFLSECHGPNSLMSSNYHTTNYNGTEYFRQAFMNNNKVVTISFVITKDHYAPGWACYYPVYKLSFDITYYDLEMNDFLKNSIYKYTIDDFIKPSSDIELTVPSDYKEIIEISNDAWGNTNEEWDSSFYEGRAKNYQKQIEQSLLEAYKKAEDLLDIKFEKKNSLLTRIFKTK